MAVRISLVSYSLEDYAVEYANALSDLCDVTLHVARDRIGRRTGALKSGVQLCDWTWPRMRSPRNPAFLCRLVSVIRSDSPDVVHNLSPTFFWFGAIARAIPRPVKITTVHDVTNHPGDIYSSSVPGTWVRWSLRQSQALIVHGTALVKQAELRFPRHYGQIYSLPLLAFDRYRRLAVDRGLMPPPSESIRVLCFGRMLPYKGISELVTSAGWVARERSDVRFIVAGKGPSIASARALAPQNANIEWIDRFVPDEEVAQLFVDADIVALPYIEASQSAVLSLAATFGKPVVATRVGSLAEVVEPSGMGLLIHPGDPREFSRALLDLVGDAELRAEMGKCAQRVAETIISHQEVAKRAFGIYRAVIEAQK